jgi:hypothetical protein
LSSFWYIRDLAMFNITFWNNTFFSLNHSS